MLSQLQSAWRARRVLLIGEEGHAPCAFMAALLRELGARPTLIAPTGDAETLCRAMNHGRVSAVIAPAAHALSEGGVFEQLSTLDTLLRELREAGVPLCILCSDVSVYRSSPGTWYAREEDPIGGQTADGLIQSMLQLYADGVSRALLGDAVNTLIVRHMPCLGAGHEQVLQYSQWCRAIICGEPLLVHAPSMQGVFLHPLDVVCGVLALGAQALDGHAMAANTFNLGVGPQNLCANRSAALRFIAHNGGTRPVMESTQCHPLREPLLDGSRARLLSTTRCQYTAEDALGALLRLERAKTGEERRHTIEAITRAYLMKLME